MLSVRQGLFFPPFDALADPRLLAEIAAEAEAAGWDGLFVWDHMLYSERVRDILDPWVCLAAMACSTSRVVLGPMVTPLARRRPAVVARQAVTLDRLSGGRLVLGFGLGDDWGSGEFSRFGDEADPHRRAAMLDEGLEVLTALLSGEEVRHAGAFYTAEDVRFLPAPARPGGIPIWLGARWPNRAPVRRAARHDGCFVIQCERPDNLHELRRWLDEAGARPGFELIVTASPDGDPEPWQRAGASWWLVQLGPYDLDVEAVRAVVAAGPPARPRRPAAPRRPDAAPPDGSPRRPDAAPA